MAKPAVILIGADKGGVGKTTIARTLIDYLIANGLRTRAFDTEAPKGTLKRFHNDITEVIDINLVPDQMKVFDTLSDHNAVTLIDIRAGLMSPTLSMLHDIGFIRAATDGHLSFVVFHVLGPTIVSLEELADTRNQLANAKHLIVKNFINNAQFFEWHHATHNAYFNQIDSTAVLSVPTLPPMAMEQVDLASVPFASFIANKLQSGLPASYSLVLRGYVHTWLSKVFAEYDRIGLIGAISTNANNRLNAEDPAGLEEPPANGRAASVRLAHDSLNGRSRAAEYVERLDGTETSGLRV